MIQRSSFCLLHVWWPSCHGQANKHAIQADTASPQRSRTGLARRHAGCADIIMSMHSCSQCHTVLFDTLSGLEVWLQASKKMLMETDFLQSLRAFDKDHIPVPVVQRIKPYIANPEFEPNKILTASGCPIAFLGQVAALTVFLLLHCSACHQTSNHMPLLHCLVRHVRSHVSSDSLIPRPSTTFQPIKQTCKPAYHLLCRQTVQYGQLGVVC